MAHEISPSSPVPEVLSPVSEDTNLGAVSRPWLVFHLSWGVHVNQWGCCCWAGCWQWHKWSHLSVSPPACLLVLQGDGELWTQAGSDPHPARGKDGCMLLCAITKGFFQSELKIEYALVTGQTFLSHFNHHLAQGAVLWHNSLNLQLCPAAVCSWWQLSLHTGPATGYKCSWHQSLCQGRICSLQCLAFQALFH